MKSLPVTTSALRLLSALTLCGTLALGACGDSSGYDTDAPLTPDQAKAPGNDGGALPDENLLEEGEGRTIGTVGSYRDEGEDDGLYEATVGMEDDNPNKSAEARGLGNDPVTPNGPLADGTIGQPDAADLPTAPSARSRRVDGSQYDDDTQDYDDAKYGSTAAPERVAAMNEVNPDDLVGLKAYVRADGAEDMPVYVPGGDPSAYVGEFYGGSGRTSPTEQPEGDIYEISTFRPAMSDVTAATYANTLTKLVNKPGSQSTRVYQPITLKVTPLLPWNAPAVDYGDDEPDNAVAVYSEECAGVADEVTCSSGAFQESIAPIVNDQRVARAIADGNVDGFSFELDRRGRVDMNSLTVLSGAGECDSEQCARLKDVLAGAIAAQRWTPARVAGEPTAARVEVPFRYDVKRLGSKVNTP